LGEENRNDMESSKDPKGGCDTAVATGVDDGIKPARVQENFEIVKKEKNR
jgi:hypothetical protein